jgi:hypothetical protein
MTNTAETWLKLAIALLTGVAAALGVQSTPAARPADVAAVVREELAPVRASVDQLSTRVAKVESIVLAADPTPR